MSPLTTRSFGPFVAGTIDTANPMAGLKGALKSAKHALFTGPREVPKLSIDPGTVLALTFKDDAGSPANVTSVLGVWPFADSALAIAHSTVTDKVYLYRLTSTMDDWYNAAGALQGTTSPQPLGSLWTSVTDPPDVTVAELLNVAYIANADAATAAALSYATKTFTIPGTIATLQADLAGAGAQDVYFSGVISFANHIHGWGFGSGTTAANGYRPELWRFANPNSGTFSASDSVTIGDRVRSERERIIAGGVAGKSLILASPYLVTRITGQGRASWYRRVVDRERGAVGVKAGVSAGDYWWFWTPVGPARIGEEGAVEILSDRVASAVARVINPAKIVAAYDPDRQRVVWYYDAGSGVRSWLAYDTQRGLFVGPDSEAGIVIYGAGVVDEVRRGTAASLPGPSAAPNTASTTSVGASSATANWVNGDASAETQVEYKRTADSTWILYTTVAAGVASVVITGLSTSTEYHWRAAHKKNSQLSSYLGPVAGSTFTTNGGTLNPPTNLVAEPSGGEIFGNDTADITWTNSGEAGVQTVVQRAPDVAGAPGTWGTVHIASVGASSCQDTVPSSGTWWYRAYHSKSGYTDSAPTAADDVVLAF